MSCPSGSLALRAKSGASTQTAERQVVEVGDVADEAGVVQGDHGLFAQAVDVHLAAAHEVLDGLDDLRRAQAVGQRTATSPSSRTTARAAQRAALGHAPRRGRASWASDALLALFALIAGPDHLGYDVAGALHDGVIAGADVLAPDVVFVVQRGEAPP